MSLRYVTAEQTTNTGSGILYPPWTACPRVAFQRDKRRARARVICVSVSLLYVTAVQTTSTGSGNLCLRVPTLRYGGTNDENGLRYFISPMDNVSPRYGSGILYLPWTACPRVAFRRYERRARARTIYIPHGQRVPALRFSETNDEPGLG